MWNNNTKTSSNKHDFLGFHLPKLARYGFLSMMHEMRTDFSMWLRLVFLLILGAGNLSIDAALARHGATATPSGVAAPDNQRRQS